MLPTTAKASGHYANSVLAAHEALDRGFDDAILLNQDGTVAEATGENVFFVKGKELVTNDATSSILPGITRDTVLSSPPRRTSSRASAPSPATSSWRPTRCSSPAPRPR